MKRKTSLWSFILVTACCLAYGDTPGWDPGTQIEGAAYGGPPWQTVATVCQGEQVTFWAEGYDVDVKADPIADDGVHCWWSYAPSAGGDSIGMGGTKANDYWPCTAYTSHSLYHSWNQPGDYTITCRMDDCHKWADDPDSKIATCLVHVLAKPQITITSPPGGEIHLASGATAAQLVGAATVAGSTLTGVQVGFTNTGVGTEPSTWYSASYSSPTWTYNWSNPTSKRIWVRATATYSSKSCPATISRDVTVSTVSNVIHVKTYANGGRDTYDGSSWALAKQRLGGTQGALSVASTGDEIWVAQGPYTENITLKAGVGLYGGFAGTESYREARDYSVNTTILDGNNGGSVVTSPAEASNDAVIDGFTITNGKAPYGGGIYCVDSSPTVSNNVITANTADGDEYGLGGGGGIYCLTSSATISRNTISSNSTGYHTPPGGGVVCVACSSISIVNNLIKGNTTANTVGGAVYFESSSGTIASNTIADNSAASSGPAVYLGDSNPVIANNIIAFNSSGISTVYAIPIMSHNDVYNPAGVNYLGGLAAGQGDISVDPLFSDRPSGRYHLSIDSPCIDQGNNSYARTDIPDIDGEYRVGNGAVDIGADESSCTGYTLTITADPAFCQQGGTSTVTTTALDPVTQDPVPSRLVTFSAAGGTLTRIYNDDPQEFNPSNGFGYTGVNGKVYAEVSRSTDGMATITAEADTPCGTRRAAASITFYDPATEESAWPMFHHAIALLGTTGTALGANLTKKWRVTLAGDLGEELWSSPVVANGVVYVGVNNSAGTLYAVDAASGNIINSRDLGSPIFGTPCVAGGSLYVCASGFMDAGVLHVLNATNLQTQWTYPVAGRGLWGSPTVYSGAVYFGTHNTFEWQSELCTVDLTTHTERSGSPAITQYSVDFTTPAIDVAWGHVYVSDWSCFVTCARSDTGGKEWEWVYHPLETIYASPTLYQGHLFVGEECGNVYKIKDQGSSRQTAGIFQVSGAVNSTAAAWNGKLYFGCNDGKLYCLDAASFTTANWASVLGVAVSSSPLVSSPTGLVYVGTEAARVYALDAATGSPAWLFDIRSQDGLPTAVIKSSPAAASGYLYIVAGDANGRYLYCFGP